MERIVKKIKHWFLTESSWKIIIWAAVILAYCGGVLTMLLPPEYSSDAQILIIQKYEGMDIYTAVKSAEYLDEILENIIYSTEFMNDVLHSNPAIIDNFGQTKKQRRKQWAKHIETDIIRHTGIMKIRVFNQNPNQAYQIAKGIISVMKNNGDKYHGRGKMVEIKIIDQPDLPVRPDAAKVIRGTVTAGIIGLIVSFLLLLILREKFRGKIIKSVNID